MDNLKFRIDVHKCKCTDCDTIVLIERDEHIQDKVFSCPVCEYEVTPMEDITVVQEVEPLINPQDLTSICLKCGIDLSNCICNEKDIPFFKGYKPKAFFNLD